MQAKADIVCFTDSPIRLSRCFDAAASRYGSAGRLFVPHTWAPPRRGQSPIAPQKAAEALLELATGGKPRVPQPHAPAETPFDHPDALRRFRVMANVEELQRALDFPWDKWTVFLHPDQREIVERDYAGPARVSGSAGTGKTIVALHRAAHLARTHPNARVLLTTFSDTLASAMRTMLKRNPPPTG
jgi:hypothetical protein